MADLSYDGEIVNSSVQNMSNATANFTNLVAAMQNATNRIVSARGFNEYIGGITTDSFSSQVTDCQTAGEAIINEIRQSQVKILSYSQDEGDIKAFLDSLDRLDYKKIDLSAIEDHIGLDRKAGNFFKGLVGDVGAGLFGFGEGLVEFGETGADLLATGFTSAASLFTLGYDKLNGTNVTGEMWDNTRAFVSTKHSENLFNSIYANTDVGRFIKNNAYGFDTVRNVSKGLGYMTGMIGLNVATGGLASGAGAVGSVGATQLAATAGMLGVASGAEQAWSEGAGTTKGLAYGAANGVWEAAQWYAGAKINQLGGVGDQVEKIAGGIFKGGRVGATTRVALDAVDGGLEGFVQPGLSMIYKDYGQGSAIENYKKAFEEAGGWSNVGTNAAMGGFMSVIGEVTDARRLLKEAKKGNVNIDGEAAAIAGAAGTSKEVFESDGGLGKSLGEPSTKPTFEAMEDRTPLSMKDLNETSEQVFRSSEDLDYSLSKGAVNKPHTYDLPEEIVSKYDSSTPVEEQIKKRFSEAIDRNMSAEEQVKRELDEMIGISMPHREDAARDLFKSSLIESAEAGNTDAYVLMHKISENNGIVITAERTTAHFTGDELDRPVINLPPGTDKRTIYHETGHSAFELFANGEEPSNIKALKESAQQAIKADDSNLQTFRENYRKIVDYSDEHANSIFESTLMETQGKTKMEYLLDLTRKYSELSEDDRNLSLSIKDVHIDDYSDPLFCAYAEMRSNISKLRSQIIEEEFPGYTTVGDMVEALFDGEVPGIKKFNYGHSAEYYSADPIRSFHEQIANYNELKLTNNEEAIQIFRSIVGDEYVDEALESTYRRMYDPNGTIKMNGALRSKGLSLGEMTDQDLNSPSMRNGTIARLDSDPVVDAEQLFRSQESLKAQSQVTKDVIISQDSSPSYRNTSLRERQLLTTEDGNTYYFSGQIDPNRLTGTGSIKHMAEEITKASDPYYDNSKAARILRDAAEADPNQARRFTTQADRLERQASQEFSAKYSEKTKSTYKTVSDALDVLRSKSTAEEFDAYTDGLVYRSLNTDQINMLSRRSGISFPQPELLTPGRHLSDAELDVVEEYAAKATKQIYSTAVSNYNSKQIFVDGQIVTTTDDLLGVPVVVNGSKDVSDPYFIEILTRPAKSGELDADITIKHMLYKSNSGSFDGISVNTAVQNQSLRAINISLDGGRCDIMDSVMGKVSPQASQSEVISAVTDGIVSHITDPSGELYIRSQPLQQTARTFIESRLKQEIDGKTIADTIYDAFKLRTQGADQKTITKFLKPIFK